MKQIKKSKKKFASDEALAKIKVLINDFYANAGRNENWGIEIKLEVLISEIEKVISESKVNAKSILTEQLKFDEENRRNKDKEHMWFGIDYAKFITTFK